MKQIITSDICNVTNKIQDLEEYKVVHNQLHKNMQQDAEISKRSLDETIENIQSSIRSLQIQLYIVIAGLFLSGVSLLGIIIHLIS